MKTRAFTIIELTIVVSIVAIIAAIAIPNIMEKNKAEAEPQRPRISSSNEIDGMPFGIKAAIVTLPTGERIMVLSRRFGDFGDGIAAIQLPTSQK